MDAENAAQLWLERTQSLLDDCAGAAPRMAAGRMKLSAGLAEIARQQSELRARHVAQRISGFLELARGGERAHLEWPDAGRIVE
jgi:hypothetical protein